MKRFTTKNNILMIECSLLNWQVVTKYAVECSPNPEFYVIHAGSLSDMWQATLIPETMILSFSSMHYSKDEVYKFKVETIEEASVMVLKFAMGMDRLDDLVGTIYDNFSRERLIDKS